MSGITLPVALPDDVLDAIARRVVEMLDERGAITTTSPSPWLDVNEAAAHLRCSRQRIYDLVHQGALAPARDGRRVLLRREHLDRYLAADTNHHEGAPDVRRAA